MTSESLFQVPGVVKDNVQAEPAVTFRLENIEKMVQSLSQGFKELKAVNQRVEQYPALKVEEGLAFSFLKQEHIFIRY